MIYVCAEIIVNGQHGYRLVSDTFETMDAPDNSVNQLIQQGRLSKEHKKAQLPLIENNRCKSNSDILTFIKRENENVICVSYEGRKIEILGLNINDYKVWNAEVVEFIKPGNICSKTLLGKGESYKELVDLYYTGRDMTVSAEKLHKSIVKSSLIGSNYTISPEGILSAVPGDGKEKLIIPDGVIDTEMITRYGTIIGGRSLNRIHIGEFNSVLDLRRCDNLIEVVFKRGAGLQTIYWNENIAKVSSISVNEFEDWKNLKYYKNNFTEGYFDKMTLKNSVVQDTIPSGFAGKCKVEHLSIGGIIHTIGDAAFINIMYCQSINFNNTVEKIGILSFGQDANRQMRKFGRDPVKITGVGNIKSIGDYAFNCMGPIDVKLEQMTKLTNIGKGAFSGCDFGDSTVYLPDSVRVVGLDAFKHTRKIRLSKRLTEKSIKNILSNAYLGVVIVPKDLVDLVNKHRSDGCNIIIEK